jgi:hypothetical protein
LKIGREVKKLRKFEDGKFITYLLQTQGRIQGIQGGGGGGQVLPPKIGKKYDFFGVKS